ncbi:hypothetical protein HNY73_003439 [Argiope bruennichi]|uniref:Uncharacterized protein n=1 Tax=Argiope bruennichi TaxID=94029 RepID=A0A8T0FSS6_ARGBR|nr:hypothetical protein HNY73_003439 [Argiope bruennichi]
MDPSTLRVSQSLDQLLEQALAERSREEEQVEVTYELTSDFVPEQRGYRLNPEEAAAAISSRNRDEEEDEKEEDTVTVIQHTELCYERLCKNGIYPVESDPEDVIESTTAVPSKATKIFIYVFKPAITIGVLIIFIFLEKVEALLKVFHGTRTNEKSLFHQTMRQMRLILLHKNVRLALSMLIFIGIEQAFIVGDFTRVNSEIIMNTLSTAMQESPSQTFIFKAFPRLSSSLQSLHKLRTGLQSVSFTMMCLGGAHTLDSIGVHVFSQHFQRPIIMAAGLVCQSDLLMVLWL